MLTSAHCAKAPPHIKIKRAKAFVDDTGRKVLLTCESCGEEKYIVEGQTSCDECRASSKRKRARWERSHECACSRKQTLAGPLFLSFHIQFSSGFDPRDVQTPLILPRAETDH